MRPRGLLEWLSLALAALAAAAVGVWLLSAPRPAFTEADELNSVSQPVIAAHEHAFSRQWFAIPNTLKMTRPGLEGYAASKPRAEIGIADLPRARKISPAHRRHPGVAATYTVIEHRHAGTLQDVKEF